MDFEVVEGVFLIKDASQALDRKNIEELADEYFGSELSESKDRGGGFLIQLTGDDDDMYTNWAFVSEEFIFHKVAALLWPEED